MCTDCGCSEIGAIAIDGEVVDEAQKPGLHQGTGSFKEPVPSHHHHDHPHPHPHPHDHHDDQKPGFSKKPGLSPQRVLIRQGILSKNDRLAAQNRADFEATGTLVLNVLSSPGAGKTTLLSRLAQDLSTAQFGESTDGDLPARLGIVVGDLATDNDAQRLRQAGAEAVQITTGNACHLEADMVARAIKRLEHWQDLDLLVIENVGNLVCPASYDLGETVRVAMLSTTEGEDKPLKYPTLFKSADVVLLNKCDVADAVGCDRALALHNIHQVAPQAKIFEVSAKTGEGLQPWYDYLAQQWQQVRGRSVHPVAVSV